MTTTAPNSATNNAPSSAPTTAMLLLRREGAVLHITLNRPELRNAMSLAMLRELQQTLAWADSTAAGDEPLRAVVLRGAGGHFCAGADLSDLAQARQRLQQDPQALVETNAAFGHMCLAFAHTGLATVAVVEGSCMGGGFGLACVADVALASETASFRLPETALGLVPAQIAPFLVERLGFSEAKRLAVTGGRLNAQEALALRLVHGVYGADQLGPALQGVLSDILHCAPGAVAATKALITRARFEPAAALVQAAAQVFSAAAQGAEGQEGTSAFLQKRKARWMPP
jgi:isohexenylglutaconyl-CoA hydratase